MGSSAFRLSSRSAVSANAEMVLPTLPEVPQRTGSSFSGSNPFGDWRTILILRAPAMLKAFEEIDVAVGDESQKDVTGLLVGGEDEERAEVVTLGFLDEAAKAEGVAFKQSADAVAVARVVGEGGFREIHLGLAVAQAAGEVADGHLLPVDDGAQATFCGREFDVPALGLVFEAEVEGRGLVEVGVEEDMENGLDQIGLAAAVAADDGVEEIGLLEGDLAVAEVLEAVDPEAAELHRLGRHFGG